MYKIAFSKEERWICRFLKVVLRNQEVDKSIWEKWELPPDLDWGRLFAIAKGHGVLALLYEVLIACPDLPEVYRQSLSRYSQEVAYQYYYLLYLSARVVRLLEEGGLAVALLKGVAASKYYRIPQGRKSGDVDLLLLDGGQIHTALDILEENGFEVERKRGVEHTYNCQSPEGVTIELHVHLVEPFDDKKANEWLEGFHIECRNHITREEIMGEVLPILERPYDVFYLLLHMLQHFLRAGFGLKMLGDWVIYWTQDSSAQEREVLESLIHAFGIRKFVQGITAVGIHYFGIKRKKVAFLHPDEDFGEANIFLREILDSEEFGQGDSGRLVTMRGTRVRDYVREFHHQMQLNHPKLGRIVLLWPGLWVTTLVVFLRNNKDKRRVSTRDILKNAKERSRFFGGMRPHI